MKVLIAVLMTVFLGLGTANSLFAGCGTCDQHKADTKAEPKAEAKDGCKGGGCKDGGCKAGKIPAEIMKKFDKDGDGKLSEAEMAECKAAHDARKAEFEKHMLEKFDADKDGKLSDTEKAAAKAAHEAKRAEFEKKMLEKFDADKDGKLSDAEKAEMKKKIGGPRGPHGGKGGEEKKAEDKSV